MNGLLWGPILLLDMSAVRHNTQGDVGAQTTRSARRIILQPIA